MEVYTKAKIIRLLENAKDELAKAAKYLTSGQAPFALYQKVANIQLDIEAFEHELFNTPTTKETKP